MDQFAYVDIAIQGKGVVFLADFFSSFIASAEKRADNRYLLGRRGRKRRGGCRGHSSARFNDAFQSRVPSCCECVLSRWENPFLIPSMMTASSSSITPLKSTIASSINSCLLLSLILTVYIIVDTKNSVGLVGCIEEVSHNAICVYWNPLESSAKVLYLTWIFA